MYKIYILVTGYDAHNNGVFEKMEFKDIVMQRYATKKFDGKKISEDRISELLEMVRFAPSALNLQPWKIKIVSDQKIKEQLLPASNNQQQVTTCSHLLVFCADSDYDGLIKRLDALMQKQGVAEDIKKMVIGMSREFTVKMSADQKRSWSQAQTYLALGNALNGAKALGFDSCPMGGFDPAEYSQILKIPANLIPVMLCPVGYAADKPMPKIRFPREDITF
jgi:nitroreductase / dihydropteridine reductase